MEQEKEPFPAIPIHAGALPGYLRTDTDPKSSSVKYRRVNQRFLFHELDRCPPDLRDKLGNSSSPLSIKLQEVFGQLVDELQDVELDANFEQKHSWQEPGCPGWATSGCSRCRRVDQETVRTGLNCR
jgi:hypothetical protein